ncbi:MULTISPECIES: tyrosine-type recombinase/integrase [unclassified Exiguobacterium]|uniref:tyrosine-type recombinase/integrase n=1 Tax=unclassified Exiguobacterium TaxID=2644629 RepID=UPI001BEB6469|nr:MULTISPECIES: tyrosine-type recombinase/integrase [unclassified Exiguobacterium]
MKDFMAHSLEEKIRKRLMGLPEFVADYIYRLENVKEVQTLFEYSKDLQLFMEFLHQHDRFRSTSPASITLEQLGTVTERDVLDFLQYLKSYDKQYQSSTGKTLTKRYHNSDAGRSRKLATLHRFLSDLERRKLIPIDPSKHLDIKVNKKAKIKNRLSPEQIERFFSVIKEDINATTSMEKAFHEKVKYRDSIIVLVLAFTGIRISECVQLDIQDVHLGSEMNYLVVVRKGGDEEVIPLPDHVAEELGQYIQFRRGLMALPDKRHQDALFLSLQKKRIHDKTVRQLLEKYQIRSGIDIKITPHVFRRTFGTNHYNQFQDMYLTAQVLGHSSAETTRKFYADPDAERVARSMRDFKYGGGV